MMACYSVLHCVFRVRGETSANFGEVSQAHTSAVVQQLREKKDSPSEPNTDWSQIPLGAYYRLEPNTD